MIYFLAFIIIVWLWTPFESAYWARRYTFVGLWLLGAGAIMLLFGFWPGAILIIMGIASPFIEVLTYR